MLFTSVYDNDKEDSNVEETEIALEKMERAIYTSLRRADISTRYSGKQIIALLMNTSPENADMVARRIIDCFKPSHTERPERSCKTA